MFPGIKRVFIFLAESEGFINDIYLARNNSASSIDDSYVKINNSRAPQPAGSHREPPVHPPPSVQASYGA